MYLETKEISVTGPVVHTCFDRWDAAIQRARLCGGFTADDVRRAASWDMCYVGSAREAFNIKYRGNGRPGFGPWDDTLANLGTEFWSAVDRNHPDEAERVAAEIKRHLTNV